MVYWYFPPKAATTSPSLIPTRRTLKAKENIPCLFLSAPVYTNGHADVTGQSRDRGCSSEEHFNKKQHVNRLVFVVYVSEPCSKWIEQRWSAVRSYSVSTEYTALTVSVPWTQRERTLSAAWAYRYYTQAIINLKVDSVLLNPSQFSHFTNVLCRWYPLEEDKTQCSL